MLKLADFNYWNRAFEALKRISLNCGVKFRSKEESIAFLENRLKELSRDGFEDSQESLLIKRMLSRR